MIRWPLAFFFWLEFLGLALWIGGMLLLGAVVAPTIFNTVTPTEMAGEAMSLIFRKFNGGLVYVCIALALVGFLGKTLMLGFRQRTRKIEAGMLVLMVGIGVYIGAIMGPQMQEARKIKLVDPSNTEAVILFDRGHRLSRKLFSMNLVLGLGLLFINGIELARREKK